MAVWSFERVASFDVWNVGLGCVPLGDPIIGSVRRAMFAMMNNDMK